MFLYFVRPAARLGEGPGVDDLLGRLLTAAPSRVRTRLVGDAVRGMKRIWPSFPSRGLASHQVQQFRGTGAVIEKIKLA
jgi:hypothetical protein